MRRKEDAPTRAEGPTPKEGTEKVLIFWNFPSVSLQFITLNVLIRQKSHIFMLCPYLYIDGDPIIITSSYNLKVLNTFSVPC